MKKHITFTVLLLTMTISAFAQLKLPVPSPSASVAQTFGMTEVKIEYSRPGVKGRNIWGGLVAYDKVWRTGANAATAITFSTDVMVDGKEVKAGSYAIFTIPNKTEWTVIINTNEGQWGSSTHKEELDLMRFKVKPTMEKESIENLQFSIDPVSHEEAIVTLAWDKLRLPFSVKANTKEMGMASIEKHINSVNWYDYAKSVEFLVDNGGDPITAKMYAERSVSMKDDHFFNKWMLAKAQASAGEHNEAIKTAKAAQKQGKENGGNWYKVTESQIDEAIKEWRKI